jgi:hypothetical protein
MLIGFHCNVLKFRVSNFEITLVYLTVQILNIIRFN